VPFEVEGSLFSFDKGEGVMTLIFDFRVFLDAGGVFFVSSGEGEVQCPSLEGSGA